MSVNVFTILQSNNDFKNLKLKFRKCNGLSGRTLRKLPVLAFSKCFMANKPLNEDIFLKALDKTLNETEKTLHKSEDQKLF